MSGGKKLLVDLVVDRYVNLDFFYGQQQTLSTGCVVWTGVTNNAGYGFIGFKPQDPDTGAPKANSTRMMTVHRLAFMIEHNRLPSQRNINHTCHNRLCLCPDHLVEGTQTEKMRAMREDGIKVGGAIKGVKRGSYHHPQHNRTYTYTTEDIQWVRTANTLDISQRYSITRNKAASMRWQFRRGYNWLPCPPYQREKAGRKPKVVK